MMEQTIIPTRHKSKIPHTLSWPIGAKAISDVLRSVRQFEQLTVDFYFSKRLAGHHGTSTPYCVIGAHYSGPIRGFSATEEQSWNPRWTINVHPVPRAFRNEIQAKIIAEALPAIRSWLVSNSHGSYRKGGHGVAFNFDEPKNELTFKEITSVLWRTEEVDR